VNSCPHCGQQNTAGVIFCAHCKRNVHYTGRPIQDGEPRDERSPTTDELELIRRIGRADLAIWICGGILVLAALSFLFSVGMASSTPEGGFLGIRIFAVVFFVWPVGLVLLVVLACSIWRRVLDSRELEKLREQG
jgi:hypothetical protein